MLLLKVFSNLLSFFLLVIDLDFRSLRLADESDSRTFRMILSQLLTVWTLTYYFFAFKLIHIVLLKITR